MTTAVFEVPLRAATNQRFQIPLSGQRFTMTIIYRAAGNAGWVLDLALEEGTPLVSGLPLVLGHDILEQHGHLGIPGQLWLSGSPPTFENLGIDCKLYYLTAE